MTGNMNELSTAVVFPGATHEACMLVRAKDRGAVDEFLENEFPVPQDLAVFTLTAGHQGLDVLLIPRKELQAPESGILELPLLRLLGRPPRRGLVLMPKGETSRGFWLFLLKDGHLIRTWDLASDSPQDLGGLVHEAACAADPVRTVYCPRGACLSGWKTALGQKDLVLSVRSFPALSRRRVRGLAGLGTEGQDWTDPKRASASRIGTYPPFPGISDSRCALKAAWTVLGLWALVLLLGFTLLMPWVQGGTSPVLGASQARVSPSHSPDRTAKNPVKARSQIETAHGLDFRKFLADLEDAAAGTITSAQGLQLKRLMLLKEGWAMTVTSSGSGLTWARTLEQAWGSGVAMELADVSRGREELILHGAYKP